MINEDSILENAALNATNINLSHNKQGEDIMSVLLAHEKKSGSENMKAFVPHESSDSSDVEGGTEMQTVLTGKIVYLFL